MNVVFDLGGVVLHWDPEAVIASVLPNAQDRQLLRADIFSHSDWVEVDRGALDLAEAIHRFSARTGIDSQEIEKLVSFVPKSLTPIAPTIELMKALKNQGHRLFCLSNMGHSTFEFVWEHHDFWPLFDGIVISAHVRMVKPDTAIYRHLLCTHGLSVEETIFVDDTASNVAAARAVGMDAILFQSPAQCKCELTHRLRL